MVNVQKNNLSPLPAGKYGKSTKRCRRGHQQANNRKSGLEAQPVWDLGVLRRLWFKTKLEAGKRRETRVLINDEKEKWIKDYVERETAVASKRVEEAKRAIEQEPDDMRNAEKAGLTTTKAEATLEEMLNAFGDSLSDLATSDAGEIAEDEDDDEWDPGGGKPSNDDEPGCVTGTIYTMVQYRIERLRQKHLKVDELRLPGWQDVAQYFRDREKKQGTIELMVPAVFQYQMADNVASSVPTSFGEPMETPDNVPKKLQMVKVTSRPGSSHMTLGSWQLQTHERILSRLTASMPYWSQIQQSKHNEPLSFNPCIARPNLINMWKSDSNEDLVMAPELPEKRTGKLAFVTMYLFEMQHLYRFCDMSAFTWLQWPNCERW